ncbi:VOC family protein [Cucumibacter marinus]|uniref:VOC family protein n=1 Tax=Cucumibacter marinus TaxID=1121252 RepID=UPI00040924C3|nr:VOC family protein [Cucumibacter marinus]
MKIKAIEHFSLAVQDFDRSVSFYREVFGFVPVFEERGMTRDIRSMTGLSEVSCDLAQLAPPGGGATLELIAFAGHELAAPDLPLPAGCGHIGIEVDDLDAALEAVCNAGAQPIGETTGFPEGRSRYCREPGGSYFELLELRPPDL